MDESPYILHDLFGTANRIGSDAENVHITCVEFWDGHLYVGTSQAKILHYLLIPPEDGGQAVAEEENLILAAEIAPPSGPIGNDPENVGVQQILILQNTEKACVLCNGTLTFYSLPELTPLTSRTWPTLSNCIWIGGTDLNINSDGNEDGDAEIVFVCLKSKIRIVRVGSKPSPQAEVPFGGCRLAVRRGNVACVANRHSYALIDISERLAMPLSEISTTIEEQNSETNTLAKRPGLGSVEEAEINLDLTQVRRNSPDLNQHTRSVSEQEPSQGQAEDGQRVNPHTRSSSQQILTTNSEFPARESSLSATASPSRSPHRPLEDSSSTAQAIGASLQSKADDVTVPPVPPKTTPSVALRPNIASPTSSEFLITIGTSRSEIGMGNFINLDGDPVRGTVQFSSYPESLVVEGKEISSSLGDAAVESMDEGFAIAVVTTKVEDKLVKALEIKRWDVEQESPLYSNTLIVIPFETPPSDLGTGNEATNEEGVDSHTKSKVAGLRRTVSKGMILMPKIIDCLGQRRFVHPESPGIHTGEKQVLGEDIKDIAFIKPLSFAQPDILLWNQTHIWWVLRNPRLLRLESGLISALKALKSSGTGHLPRPIVHQVYNSIRDQEAGNALDFLSFQYIRQKSSLLLYFDLVNQALSGAEIADREIKLTEEAILKGEVDPRLLLLFLPLLKDEVVTDDKPILIQSGLQEVFDEYAGKTMSPRDFDVKGPAMRPILYLMKNCLNAWRKKRDFQSIGDMDQIRKTVDAALLHVLLIIDQDSPRGKNGSLRSELHAVADKPGDCFDRAVELLENYNRLYVLSRLYQSRRMSAKVLSTWSRILEGEFDAGGDFVGGERQVQAYLRKLSNKELVIKWGIWLALRSPELGVEVFAERDKFDPKEAVTILQEYAPNVVKDYLEHLVFSKQLLQFAQDLIVYYLSSVIETLKNDTSAHTFIRKTYTDYRNLRNPKPSYNQFASTLNQQSAWWRNRLRLLQLLDGSDGTSYSYNVDSIMDQISEFEEELVPEMIILYGRSGKHEEAIRLLVHGLGDFDTAVTFCLRGGTSAGGGDELSRQKDLFKTLLSYLLQLPSSRQRVVLCSALLDRFGSFFDIEHVLLIVPGDWPVNLLGGYLEGAVRRVIAEKRESQIVKNLAQGENRDAEFERVKKADMVGAMLVRDAGQLISEKTGNAAAMDGLPKDNSQQA